jgi:hypothetical protein
LWRNSHLFISWLRYYQVIAFTGQEPSCSGAPRDATIKLDVHGISGKLAGQFVAMHMVFAVSYLTSTSQLQIHVRGHVHACNYASQLS